MLPFDEVTADGSTCHRSAPSMSPRHAPFIVHRCRHRFRAQSDGKARPFSDAVGKRSCAHQESWRKELESALGVRT